MLLLNNYETNKLEHIEVTLEKSIKNVLHKFEKHIPYLGIDILELDETAEKLRNQQINCTRSSIQNITKSLKSKIDLLKNKKMSQIKDFEKFKTEMVDIQENLMNMKRDSKAEFNKLKIAENDLNDELDMYYNVKVTEWSENISISSLEFVPPRIKSTNSGQCKEVKQFFDFVHQSGGHENGWRREDHLLFLKLRGKYKKADDLAYHLNEILPDISIEDIKSHEEWYRKYLNLQSKKKDAINRWKQNKDSDNNVNKRTERIDNTKYKKEDTGKLREKLMQWKTEKEEKLLIYKEMEKQRLLEKIEKERVKKQKQIEMKKIVNDWRESKIIFEQSQKQNQRIFEEMEKKRRATNANKLIKQFQSMDELHIFKMRQIHKKFTEEPKQRVQSGPPVLRDPQRLMKPTIQWAQRVRAIREPMTGPLPIFATPKLAIPEWRKSIM